MSSSWRPRLPRPSSRRPAPLLGPACRSPWSPWLPASVGPALSPWFSCCSVCRSCRRCPGPGCSSAACRTCRGCCCFTRSQTNAVLPPSLHALWFPGACLAASCSRCPVLESPLARAQRSPRVAPAIPCLGVGAVSVLVLPRLVPALPPWSLARFRVAFSLSWLRDSLSLALPSSPIPSSSSVSRPTSLSFLSTLASSYSAPDILACHSFPSVVWNSPVVQKTDYRLQQRRYE